MVGLNLLAVGAVAETHLGDTPTATASPSEGVDFAGVLGTMLPAGEPPKPDEAATPDAPDADALGAQFAAVGLMTLPLPLSIEPTTTTDYPHRRSNHACTLRGTRGRYRPNRLYGLNP